MILDKQNGLGLVACIAALGAMGSAAQAGTAFNVISSSDNGSYGSDSQFLMSAGTASSSIINVNGFAHGYATASGGQFVSGAASTSGIDNGTETAASVSYTFTINGPTPLLVPVIILGGGTLSASNSGNGQDSSAFVEVDADLGNFYSFDRQCSAFAQATCGSFAYGTTFNLMSGVETTGDLKIFILSGDGGGLGNPPDVGSISVSGSIDPMFTIDPGFAAAHPGYSISFSDGVTNGTLPPVGGVPEPAQWALMLLGFGLAGAAIRRRRAIAS